MGFVRKYKKIFLIIIFIGIVALITYLILNVFFGVGQKEESRSPEDLSNFGGLYPAEDGSGIIDITGSGGQLNPSGDIIIDKPRKDLLPNIADQDGGPSDVALGGLTKASSITSGPVLKPSMGSDGVLRYYNRSDGKFYRLDAQGNLVALSDTVFHKVQNVTWASNGEKAILEYPDGNKIVYDFNKQKQVTLPKHWQDFSFSPNGQQISAKSIAYDVENRHLIVANADGSKAKSLSPIGENADKVYPIWSPNNQAAAMYLGGVDFNRQEVFFVGLNDENFKSTIVNGRGFEPKWSTEGDRLLYSVYNSDNRMNPRLWIVNAQGDDIGSNRNNLGLDTWASKCTFATNNEVYCAVPRSLPEGSGMFPELAEGVQDLLYKINIKNNTKTLIAIPDNATTITDIMVGSDQNKLYFTDDSTGRIYSINLK